jgi:anti-sigma factor ChrR (cupin superfamily)
MNCPMELGGNGELLLDYAAGKLKAGAREQMEQHLAACSACREFAGAQQVVWQALEDWEPAEVSLDFDRRLYARIEQDASWWTRWTTNLLRPLSPLFRHSVPIAAAAGVVILAGLLMNRPAAVPATPTPQSAQVEALQPEQLESALADMEMLREFNHLVPDNAGPKM